MKQFLQFWKKDRKITNKIVEFYFNSRDFNGYPVGQLKKDFSLSDENAKKLIGKLIVESKVDCLFGNIHPNPHIKAFSGITIDKQVEFLNDLDFSDHFCLYPTSDVLNQYSEVPNFNEKPFTKELAFGSGQLDFRVFDLSVLEYYRNDPRYFYQTDFINGSISIHDEYFESKEMPEHDQVLLQTFGFAHDQDLNKAVAVFLRYLSGLSPEHQKLWKAKQLKEDFHLHLDYLRNSMGEWGTKIPIFDAFTQELEVINKMAVLMGRPHLFRKDYNNNRPRNFGFLLRPTLTEFNSFVLLLDQLMSDNLNKKFFASDLELEEDHQREDGKTVVRQKGTIALLNEWSHEYFRPTDPQPLDDMVATFKKVRKLRQKPAHSIREDVFDQKYLRNQRDLIIKAYDSVRTLRLMLANHPNVKANPPEINEFLYEGKIWTI